LVVDCSLSKNQRRKFARALRAVFRHIFDLYWFNVADRVATHSQRLELRFTGNREAELESQKGASDAKGQMLEAGVPTPRNRDVLADRLHDGATLGRRSSTGRTSPKIAPSKRGLPNKSSACYPEQKWNG
jgi:hypothetical protein